MLPVQRNSSPRATNEHVALGQRLLWFVTLYLAGVATPLAASLLLKDLLMLLR
jgi:hypothetical protein